jgi:hypothetical protein
MYVHCTSGKWSNRVILNTCVHLVNESKEVVVLCCCCYPNAKITSSGACTSSIKTPSPDKGNSSLPFG